MRFRANSLGWASFRQHFSGWRGESIVIANFEKKELARAEPRIHSSRAENKAMNNRINLLRNPAPPSLQA